MKRTLLVLIGVVHYRFARNRINPHGNTTTYFDDVNLCTIANVVLHLSVDWWVNGTRELQYASKSSCNA